NGLRRFRTRSRRNLSQIPSQGQRRRAALPGGRSGGMARIPGAILASGGRLPRPPPDRRGEVLCAQGQRLPRQRPRHPGNSAVIDHRAHRRARRPRPPSFLRSVALARAGRWRAGMMSTPVTALYAGRIYPGLRPFGAEDALLFFGRDPQTDELLRRLDDTRFLAVVGLSGSGKSSLVRSGLLPALRRGHLCSAGSQWRFSVMRPGSDPLGALAQAFDETLGDRSDRLRTLRSGSLGLLDASRHGRKADENVLLVVDQFEEIFRFQDAYRQRADEAAEFVELLLAACQEYEPARRAYVVITLR